MVCVNENIARKAADVTRLLYEAGLRISADVMTETPIMVGCGLMCRP